MFLLSKIILSTVEFSAMVLVCLSLFRIYFRYSLHKVALIAFIMSVISVYIRDILNEPSFAALPVLVTEIVLITLLFRLPLIFSLLICVIGSLATALVEGLVGSLASHINYFSQEMLQTSLIQFMLYELLVTVLLLCIIFPLQKYKLGFHTTSNDALKSYNFLLSGILIIAVVVIQIQVLAYKQSSLHLIIPIFIGVVFLTGVYLSYKHNQKLWKERRERLSRK